MGQEECGGKRLATPENQSEMEKDAWVPDPPSPLSLVAEWLLLLLLCLCEGAPWSQYLWLNPGLNQAGARQQAHSAALLEKESACAVGDAKTEPEPKQYGHRSQVRDGRR